MSRHRGIGPAGMAGMVGLWGASSLIASVQYGMLTMAGTSTTATITAVNTSCAVLVKLNQRATGNADGRNVRLSLTNTTTVTGDAAAASTTVVPFVVVEFMPGVLRSLQYGTVTIANPAITATATVTNVNTAKAVLVHNGNTYNIAGAQLGGYFDQSLTLTNATTVTGDRMVAQAGDSCVAAFCLVELF